MHPFLKSTTNDHLIFRHFFQTPIQCIPNFCLFTVIIRLTFGKDLNSSAGIGPTTIVILLLTTSFTLAFAIKNYYSEKDIFYNSLTEYLQNYNINFDKKIDMKTTMDPIYVNDSCRLINKYSKSMYINMISIHDSYIPFMCNKANAKYDQLIINMVNSKIKVEVYNYFKNQDLIFVDNILIKRNSKVYYDDYMIAEDFQIKTYATDRAKDVLEDLQEDNFTLIEKGKLISIYKKIN